MGALLPILKTLAGPVFGFLQKQGEVKENRRLAKMDLEKERIIARRGSWTAGLIVIVMLMPVMMIEAGYLLEMFGVTNNYEELATQMVKSLDDLFNGYYQHLLGGILASIFGISVHRYQKAQKAAVVPQEPQEQTQGSSANLNNRK